jgi:hypothetical protein
VRDLLNDEQVGDVWVVARQLMAWRTDEDLPVFMTSGNLSGILVGDGTVLFHISRRFVNVPEVRKSRVEYNRVSHSPRHLSITRVIGHLTRQDIQLAVRFKLGIRIIQHQRRFRSLKL